MIYDDFSKIIKQGEFQRVYRPNDDSFLFLKTILQDKPQGSLFVEIGSGSGFVIGNVAKTLEADRFIAIDINIDACELSQRFFNLIGANVEIINGDGLNALNPTNQIDVLLFNPPYVPTEPEELKNAKQYIKEKQTKYLELYQSGLRGDELSQGLSSINLIDCSYAGGESGMEITWKVLENSIPKISMGGVMQTFNPYIRYLFMIAENDVKAVAQFMIDRGFSVQILSQQQKYNEIQFVVRFRKISGNQK